MNRLPFSASLLAALFLAQPAVRADILDTKFVSGWDVSLSDAGALDWAVFGSGSGRDATAQATDFKKGGDGIGKEFTLTGEVAIHPDTEAQLELRWNDGAVLAVGRRGDGPAGMPCGMRARLAPGGAMTFSFKGTGRRMASLVFRHATNLRVTARQGTSEKPIGGEGMGAAQVVWDGAEPLVIELRNAGTEAVRTQGFAATLSQPGVWWMRDGRFALFFSPRTQEELLARAQATPQPDYLRIAREFADCMLEFGRDRYGDVASPLFSNILTRGKEPATTPYPLFGEKPLHSSIEPDKSLDVWEAQREEALAQQDPTWNPYWRYDWDNILNYPAGVGAEGPHKVTLFGCDPYEDRALYRLLSDLTRITGEPRYEQAGGDALRYWFQQTQGPSGLYPWGEHMSWDLVNDCPLYFKGPMKDFFEANYHEVRDFVPFIDILANLPSAAPGEPTPLEKYALGIWQTHFWEKEKGYYNRHGDYLGKVNQAGQSGGFPAHLAYYLRAWGAAYGKTENPAIKEQLGQILGTALNMAVSRTEKHGFYPFSFDPETKGKPPGDEVPGQSLRLAHHAALLARELKEKAPALSAKFQRLADLHLGDQPFEVTQHNLAIAEELGDTAYLMWKKSASARPAPTVPDLTASVLSADYAGAIMDQLRLYRESGDEDYLRAAETSARMAHLRFCDDASPLPRAFAKGAPMMTREGKPFPDFYFQGAPLMQAFARLGDALAKKKGTAGAAATK